MTGQAIRCAIYTRKSSEEGLEQAFNSLDAQREACAAYVQSQRHEGWTELPAENDDSGISGGTLQQTTLQQLLEDIQASRIDNVVVYKVDRLTRSLADFAKIIDVFDAQGVSFVSVTQQFNTTTSMGRLTLNMLLSFAQFEREVTGERTRDKIAASKAKGMWMGGLPPLGYDAIDRQLQVNEAEAETVRHVFRRYGEIGKVDALRRELAGQGVVGKLLQRQDGRLVGGKPLQRGALYRMLQNPIYRGQIRHRAQVHPGQHPAIIDEDQWQAVQNRLEANRIADANKTNARAPSLLVGKIRTDAGDPFTPSHANKNGKRYRYYVSRPAEGEYQKHRRWRLPAGEVEGLVIAAIGDLLSDAKLLRPLLAKAGVAPIDQHAVIDAAAARARDLTANAAGDDRTTIRNMIAHVIIAEASLSIGLAIPHLLQVLDAAPVASQMPLSAATIHEIVLPVRLKRTGLEMRLVDERTSAQAPDPALIRLLSRAWAIRSEVLQGDGRSLNAIATSHGIGSSYLSRLLRLGFLGPDIVETILNGKQPPDLTANRLATLPTIPTDWNKQRQVILGTPDR